MWKLWQQIVEDVAEQVFAECEGLRRLEEAKKEGAQGNLRAFQNLWRKAARVYGIRATTRFMGGFPPPTASAACREKRAS